MIHRTPHPASIQLNHRALTAFAAVLLVTGSLAALWPRSNELFEAQLRDAPPAQATRLLEAARTADPEDAAINGRLAVAYGLAGQPVPALDALARVGRQRALTRSERALAIRMAYAEGRPAAAIPLLTGPLETLVPDDREALVRLALAGNQPRLALIHQAALTKLSPTRARLERLRDIARSAGAYQQAIAVQRGLAATNAQAELETLLALHLQANDPKAALEACERLAARHPAPRWHRRAAELAQWARLPGRAVPHMLALYAQTPSPEAGLRVMPLIAASQPSNALPFARRLVRNHPADARVFDNLIALLAKAGRLPEAREALGARVARYPADATAHHRRVDFLLAHSDRSGAIRELSRWVARSPRDAAARHQLAVVQVWDGRVAAGWNTYELLLADASGPMDALETRWRQEWLKVSGSLEDFTPAGRANLKKLAAERPGDLAVWRRLAAAENESGDRASAIRSQRHLVAQPRATGTDALRLAEWLLWDERTEEGLALLRQLDARTPLPRAVLLDAVERASHAWRFADAADFLGRMAARWPQDTSTLEALARAREAAGDLPGAASAWEARLLLPGATDGHRLMTAGLWMKRNQLDRALDVVSGPEASLSELRLQVYLASRLNRLDAQQEALEALVERTPTDWASRLSLAELAERRGDADEVERQETAALGLRPRDPELLTRLAARKLYGANPEAAEPVVTRLAALPNPGADGWRVLADFYQTREPERAASALDRLHEAGQGDAETYFRRGELAASQQVGSAADAAFTEAARQGAQATAPGEREAAAYSLERLGRGSEADVAWSALKQAYPTRPAAHASLIRHRLSAGDTAGAEGLLAAAEAQAPGSLDLRILRAEWLRAVGREAEAAEAFAAAKAVSPGAHYLAAAEAMSRHAAGQHGRARAVAREALASAPLDIGLAEANRLVRDRGASRVEARAFLESAGNLDRTRAGVSSTQRLGDRWRLLVDVEQLAWSGGTLHGQELRLGTRWGTEALEAAAHVAVQTNLSAPLGGASVALRRGPLDARVAVDEARWEDTNLTVIRGGRERKLTAEAGWRPDPRVSLRAGAAVGQLTADGLAPALSANGLLEAQARVAADSPWVMAYQLQHRHWGPAGPPMGLQENLTMQSVLAGFDGRVGPVRVDLRPGVAHDLNAGVFVPLVGGSLAWDVGPDQEIAVSGFWSNRSLNAGVDGSYHQLSVNGQWWF